ncbi:MAG: metal-dependent transcriptional regulator, partial [Clostridia bacterium]|nr:metal-dependent transcriptional regulator [Clostridia bacterium]
MNLTANQMRCLLAILSLTRMNEEVASKNVARLLGVTRPSVHKALDILAGKELIEKAHYGAAKLT